jgi:ankyrin repeat protein
VNERAQKGNTPLHIIASIEQNDYWHPNNSSYASFAELLLQHGADVNLTDIEHGKTPLMIAVKSENLSVIRALVSNFKKTPKMKIDFLIWKVS